MAASSITISLKAEGSSEYLGNVSDLVVGNMVDPLTGAFWFAPTPENPWTWDNSGNNVNTFGLMANYKYQGVEKTAFSQLVIDPSAMSDGNHKVEAVLCTCAIDGSTGNPILRFKSVKVDGTVNNELAKISEWGTDKPQPSCDFYTK